MRDILDALYSNPIEIVAVVGGILMIDLFRVSGKIKKIDKNTGKTLEELTKIDKNTGKTLEELTKLTISIKEKHNYFEKLLKDLDTRLTELERKSSDRHDSLMQAIHEQKK